jgi:hypothetical protein
MCGSAYAAWRRWWISKAYGAASTRHLRNARLGQMFFAHRIYVNNGLCVNYANLAWSIHFVMLVNLAVTDLVYEHSMKYCFFVPFSHTIWIFALHSETMRNLLGKLPFLDFD